MMAVIVLTMMSLLLFVKSTDFFLLFRALINITKHDGQSIFITIPVIHQIVPLCFFYYYYAAFNAPCVGHNADESQAHN